MLRDVLRHCPYNSVDRQGDLDHWLLEIEILIDHLVLGMAHDAESFKNLYDIQDLKDQLEYLEDISKRGNSLDQAIFYEVRRRTSNACVKLRVGLMMTYPELFKKEDANEP